MIHSGKSEAIVAAIDATCVKTETPCGDGTLMWRTWGTGPALLLLHGGHGSWTHWIRNVEAFARTHTVVVPDLPGDGESAMPPQPIDLDVLTSIVVEGLRRTIPGCESLDLVGFSFGGLIGGLVARDLGARVRNLVLVATSGIGEPQRAEPLVSLRGITDPDEIAARQRRNLAILMIADPANIDELAVHLQVENIRQSRIRGLPFDGHESLRDVLAALPARVSGIWGAEDASLPGLVPERAALLKELSPGANVTIVPGAGHWVSYETAGRFNQIVESEIARTS